MKTRLIVQALLALFLFPAFLHAMELSEKDNGRKVSLHAGKNISIRLAGNPTTGYGWELSGIDRAVLANDPESSYKADSPLIGAGGEYIFRFTALKPGTSSIKLAYRRSWEKDVPPARTLDLSVTVLPPESGITAVSYRSADGKTATVFFDSANNVTVVLPDGKSITLPSAMSASGIRYSNEKETFWEHQGTGRFFKGETVVFEGGVSKQ